MLAVPEEPTDGCVAVPGVAFIAELLIQSIIPPQIISHIFCCGSLSDPLWLAFSIDCVVAIPGVRNGY